MGEVEVEVEDEERYIERLNIILDGYKMYLEPNFDLEKRNDIVEKLIMIEENEFLERCNKAILELRIMADEAEKDKNFSRLDRLYSKIDGIKLAKYYYETSITK